MSNFEFFLFSKLIDKNIKQLDERQTSILFKSNILKERLENLLEM